MLAVIGLDHDRRGPLFRVRCDCGTEKLVVRQNFDRTRSCGCYPTGRGPDSVKSELRIGATYWRLRVESIERCDGTTYLVCKCSCGKMFRGVLGNIVSGGTKSCGCLAAESRHSVMANTQTRHALYSAWKQRVSLDPPAMVGSWRSDFWGFVRDVGERPPGSHLIPVRNDEPLGPDNFRWATRSEQARSSPGSAARIVWVKRDGERVPASTAASALGLTKQAISQRIKSGWSPEEASTVPKGARRDPGRRQTR